MVIKSTLIPHFYTRHTPWSLAHSCDCYFLFLLSLSPLKRSNFNPCTTISTNTTTTTTATTTTQSLYSTISRRSLLKIKTYPFFLTRRQFHNYFLTNLPSTLRSDSSRSSTTTTVTSTANLHHHNNLSESSASSLPQSSQNKHLPSTTSITNLSTIGVSRELIVVRIPLKSAKHHFGVSQSRGTRLTNEDTYQAGTIEIPAFAKRGSIDQRQGSRQIDIADSASGGPQVFCFGVFDGHGGKECSDFLKEKLHEYIEKTADLYKIECSLQSTEAVGTKANNSPYQTPMNDKPGMKEGFGDLQGYMTKDDGETLQNSLVADEHDITTNYDPGMERILQLEKSLMHQWKDTVGGYFRRFKPQHFSDLSRKLASIESVLMYAFLKADFDFISTQAHRPEKEEEINSLSTDTKSKEIKSQITNRPTRFLGGSTASIALISTPTPTPFWHPSSPSTMIVAHVGDTRIILCNTATGLAKPCTTNHHPSSPGESRRLRRYATSFVTDSFGEERISGLANTRSFGDIHSKRIGVSAEPDIYRIELMAAEYSMLVLVSDGISGTLNDQEIVDIVKEAKTPEQGARDVVGFATEVSKNGDNATCLVVRLGGWEKRREGGLGSMGTIECREWRRKDAGDMRTVERHR